MTAFPDELHGARLRLCRKRLSDVDDVIHAISISLPELRKWMKWAETMPTRESMVAKADEDTAHFDNDESWAYWIREIDGGQLVGSAALRRGGDRQLEIGYWVRSDRTGRGYATEATAMLTTAAFESALDVATVMVSMDSANTASAAVPQRLGYRRDREYERDVETPGHSGNGIAWVIGRQEWRLRAS
jgi:RimJ/RimL family protein N-acetyltransferase